jgi:hypothetical protein
LITTPLNEIPGENLIIAAKAFQGMAKFNVARVYPK